MSKVRKAVVPLAGRGTRQYPASSVIAKGMFPVVDRDGVCKPVVQMVCEECVESGIEEICLVVQPGDEELYREYFRRIPDDVLPAYQNKPWAIEQSEKLHALGQRLRFATQYTPEGYGHAVYQAHKFAAGEPVLLSLGDHVYVSNTARRCARQLIDLFERNNLAACSGVQLTPEKDLMNFGTIRGKHVAGQPSAFEAELIVEKPSVDQARRDLTTPGLPAGNFLGHFGLHVFSAEIFDVLSEMIARNEREKNEFQLTAAQETLRQRRGRYWVGLVDGKRYDTGIPEGYLETQIGLALCGKFRHVVEDAKTT